MSYEYSEDALIEQATQDTLEDLGWFVTTAWRNETLGKEGLLGREDKTEIILKGKLEQALKNLNPGLPQQAYDQAIEIIDQREADKKLARINKEKYDLFKNGVPVSFTNDKNEVVKKKLKVFDFRDYSNNNFLAVRQFEVFGQHYNRRPDVIGFVNGIPLIFIELKAHHTDLRHAYDDNLKDYKEAIPELFHSNAFIILSNGTDSKVGTITSPYKYFLDWKRIEEEEEGVVSLDTMLKGTCAPHRFMDIFENFLLYDNAGGEVAKLMAKNHQYLGVNKVMDNARNIDDLKGKLGVFWHTQGSGKSYSMVFLSEKIHRKFGGSYTFLIVLDRTELQNQIYDTFSGVGAVNNKNVIAGNKKGMTGREHLRELLAENHKYVFTLIHKFSIDPKEELEYPLITERKNIIVISDEAHRTQAGTYARNMRYNGIPNASYLGFTGTPIIKEEEEITKNIFGDYVSIYDFKRAIEDEATLPLLYLNKGEKLNIDNPELDEQMAEVFENEDLDEDQKKKLEYLFNKDYPVLTAEPRLRTIAKDLVWHFNERGYQGKAMFVALDKPTAVRMFDYVKEYWPKYLLDLENRIQDCEDIQEERELRRKYQKVKESEFCVVVSSEQNEIDKFRKLGLDIGTHRQKMVERNLEKEFKDPENPFRLAIVCAMWITGFDAQCVSTVYLDKPIKGHTLMQTIARANRVYDDEKENGLIVDYGNVYKQLEKAYSVYGEGGKSQPYGGEKGPEKPVELTEEQEGELKKAIQKTESYLKELDFDLCSIMDVKPMEKIGLLNQATEKINLNETSRASFEVMARNVFRKYKALFPNDVVKPYIKKFNAIDAIYSALNQKVKSADVTEIIKELQAFVSESILVQENGMAKEDEVYVDLSSLDFDKLKIAFSKSKKKNSIVYNLQEAVEKKVQQMIQDNPLRLEFYDRYKEIIDEYNRGKSYEDTIKAFERLNEFIRDLDFEDKRAMRESIDQDTLAIFDLLKEGKELNDQELKSIKKIAVETLNTLKDQKLNIDRWRESRMLRSQIKTLIYEKLLWLPQDSYSDAEVGQRAADVYQHIYTMNKRQSINY